MRNGPEQGLVVEEKPVLPIIPLTLTTTLDEIPKGPPCPCCGNQTEKTYLAHTTFGSKIRTEAQTPGYKCVDEERCEGVSFLSDEGLLESLIQAHGIHQAHGDNDTALNFEPIIDRLRGRIERNAAVNRTSLP